MTSVIRNRLTVWRLVMTRDAKLKAFVVVVAGTIVLGGRPALAQPTNVVIQWNQLAQAQYGPGASAIQRTLAILHIAMFDAINAIERVYTPYLLDVHASAGASAEAAAAQAGHDVLSTLFPAQQ